MASELPRPPQPGEPVGRSLPLGSFDAVGERLTPSGAVIADSIVVQSSSGRFYKASVSDVGGVVAWLFVSAPSCAEIAALFARCSDLASTVTSCAQLATWGYA